ncbi:MAG: serine/threonine protein phosphatase PrpC [Myxococcota bacterium]|jgi:serine/threonine protein phosphatase PrpC
MNVETASVFAPGAANDAWPGQIVRDDALGLLAIASPSGFSDAHQAATQIALDAVRTHIQRNTDILRRFHKTATPGLRDRILQILREGFRRAAHETFAFARRHEGLTVSLDVLLIAGKEAFVAHAGDGRGYLIRRGILHQLTIDHVNPATSPPSLLHALGPRPAAHVETLCMEIANGDRFLVANSSLWRAISEDKLLIAITTGSPRDLARRLAISLPQHPLVAATAVIGAPDVQDTATKLLGILAPMPLFMYCSEVQLRQVAQATHPRRFGTGLVLFHQGDPGAELYLVIEGKIRIERDGQHIVTIGPGSNFGEMAMLDEPFRSATAIVQTPCELLVIKKEAFFSLLRDNPLLAVKILWNMLLTVSSNLRTSTARLAEVTGDATLPRPPTPDQPLEVGTNYPEDLTDTLSGE